MSEEINSPSIERANIPPPKVLVHQASEPDKSDSNAEENQTEDVGADPHDMIEVENPPKASPETGESNSRKDTDSPTETDEKDNTQRDSIPQSETSEKNVVENGKHGETEEDSKDSQLANVETVPEVVSDSAQEVDKPEETKEISQEVVADGRLESDVLGNDGLAHSIMFTDSEKSIVSEVDVNKQDKIPEPSEKEDLQESEEFMKNSEEKDVPSEDPENTASLNAEEEKHEDADNEHNKYERNKSSETPDLPETDAKDNMIREIANSYESLSQKLDESEYTENKEYGNEANNNQKKLSDEDASLDHRNSSLITDTSEFATLEEIIEEQTVGENAIDLKDELPNTNPISQESNMERVDQTFEHEENAERISNFNTTVDETPQNKTVAESLEITPAVSEVDKSESPQLSTKHEINSSMTEETTGIANIVTTFNEPSAEGDEQNQNDPREQDSGSVSKLSNTSEKSESPTVVEHEVVEKHDSVPEMTNDDNSVHFTRQLEQYQETANLAEKARLVAEDENDKLRTEIKRLEREMSGQTVELDELRLRLERLTKDDQDNVQNNKKLMDEVQTLKDRIAKLQQNLDHHMALNNGNSNMVEPHPAQNKKSSVCSIL